MNTQNHWKTKLPWIMTVSRAALGPLVLLISQTRPSSFWLAACIVVALLLDIFDGILARLWNLATPRLRRCDTLADTVFYACVFLVVLINYPATVKRIGLLLIVLVVLEIIQHIFSLLKFGRLASYHSNLSKMWGLLLASALIALLGFGWDKLIDISIGWGILCNLEGFAMSFVLPAWQHDIPTLRHAVWLRRELEYQSKKDSKAEVLGV